MSESKEPNIKLKGFKLEAPEVEIRIEGGETYISAPKVTANDVHIIIEDGRVCVSGSSTNDHEPKKIDEGKEHEAQGKGRIGKILGKIKNRVKTIIPKFWLLRWLGWVLIIVIVGAILSAKGGISQSVESLISWQFWTFGVMMGGIATFRNNVNVWIVMLYILAAFLLYASLKASPFAQISSWLENSIRIDMFAVGVTVLALFVAIMSTLISRKSK